MLAMGTLSLGAPCDESLAFKGLQVGNNLVTSGTQYDICALTRASEIHFTHIIPADDTQPVSELWPLESLLIKHLHACHRLGLYARARHVVVHSELYTKTSTLS